MKDFLLGEWKVCPKLNRVVYRGHARHLSPKVMEVLVCLAKRQGDVVSKDELFGTIWPGTFVTDDALVRCVVELRRVFHENAREPRIIETISKRGYRILAPVTWCENDTTPQGGFRATNGDSQLAPENDTAPKVTDAQPRKVDARDTGENEAGSVAPGGLVLTTDYADEGSKDGSERYESTTVVRRGLRILRVPWLWATALVVILTAMAFLFRVGPRTSPGAELVRLSIDVGMELPSVPRSACALLSPDGTRIVFLARGSDGTFRLYTRVLSNQAVQLLQGTEGAAFMFFSPDGKWVGYFAGDRLMKAPVEGGQPVTLCNAPFDHVRGASWGSDGTIVAALASNSGLMRVPADGGTPMPATSLDKEKGEVTHRWPQVLPGARAVLFTASVTGSRYDEASIEVQSLETGRRKTLIRGGYYGRYLASGHLVYARGTTLFAVPMNAERLELEGSPTAVLDDVVTDPDIGLLQFDCSQTGKALCLTGKWRQWPRSLAWVDHSGNAQPMSAAPQAYGDVRVSPDGKRLALSIGTDDAQWYIALYDWQRDRLTRLTFGGVELTPQWFPDGYHVAFTSDRHGGMQNLYAVRADGGGEPKRLSTSSNIQVPFSFAPKAACLAFVELHPATGQDIWTLPLGGAATGTGIPVPFLCTPAEEKAPAFSPDGRWIAYESNEGGGAQSEVYVRSWSRTEIKWQVSPDGGGRPVWSRTGDELYYENREHSVMAVSCIAKDDAVLLGKPALRFAGPIAYGINNARNFDPSPDGRLAVILARSGNRPPMNQLTILLNFFDELHRRTGR